MSNAKTISDLFYYGTLVCLCAPVVFVMLSSDEEFQGKDGMVKRVLFTLESALPLILFIYSQSE
jgi:hypothetical protein